MHSWTTTQDGNTIYLAIDTLSAGRLTTERAAPDMTGPERLVRRAVLALQIGAPLTEDERDAVAAYLAFCEDSGNYPDIAREATLALDRLSQNETVPV